MNLEPKENNSPSEEQTSVKTDPITLEILRHQVIAIAEEMGAVLKRASQSPNIKERMDASCALFDASAKLVAQADHIPVHLGSMPFALKAVTEKFREADILPGDIFLLNDPFQGGTHLPDLTMVRPLFYTPDSTKKTTHVGWLVCKAHHSDIGGMTPGSMPSMSRDIQSEGLRIPPVKLIEGEKIVNCVLDMVLANTRTPTERLGDLNAQIAALRKGEERFQELIAAHSYSRYAQFVEDLYDYNEKRVIRAMKSFIPGKYQASELLEGEVKEKEGIKLTVTLTVTRNRVHFNFDGTAAQVVGNLNAPPAVTHAAVYYVFRTLTDPSISPNHGSYRPLSISIPRGSLLNPDSSQAVAAGNVETSQRVVDLLYQAFEPVCPGKVPAQSQGTMNNVTLGGLTPEGIPFTYYETIGGGEGAYSFRDGQSGLHTHMTNTANTPVEVIETRLPIRILTYALRKNSAGKGLFNGGEGVVKEFEMLTDNVSVNIISERRRFRPRGIQGGGDGDAGANFVVRKGKEPRKLPSKVSLTLNRGDRLVIKTPGGGGWGSESAV